MSLLIPRKNAFSGLIRQIAASRQQFEEGGGKVYSIVEILDYLLIISIVTVTASTDPVPITFGQAYKLYANWSHNKSL